MEEQLPEETRVLNGGETFPTTVRSRFDWTTILPIVPIPVFLVLLFILVGLDVGTVFEPPWLLPALNTLFLAILPLTVVYVATKGYVHSGLITLLMLGTGTLTLGLGASLAGWVMTAKGGGPNAVVTVHNLSTLLSAMFYCLGVVLAVIGLSPRKDTWHRKLNVTLIYLGVAILMALLTIATLKGFIPVFFVQGEGPTVWRQTVLVTAIALFILSGVLLAGLHLFSRTKLLYWYLLALFLLATGLICILFQKSVGGPIGWLGRSALYLAGVYLLVSVISASRDLRFRGKPLEKGIANLFRHHLEFLVEERTSQLSRANEQLSREIAGRKKAEDALRESEQMLKIILSTSPVGIALTKERRIEWANEAWRQMFGFEDEHEYLGQDARMLYPSEEEYEHAGKMLYQDIETGKIGETDTKFRRKDGSVFDAIVQLKALDPLDPAKGGISAVSDISSRKRSEKALKEGEERFRNVFEQGPLGIAIVGLDYRWLAVNAALCEMLGYTEDELTGLTFVDITHPDHIEANLGYAEKLSRGEIPSYSMEKRYMGKNGGVVWVSMTASTLLDDQGQVLYFLVMFEDITARKKTEEALRESEEKFAKSFQHAPVLITLSNVDDGTYLEVNDQFCEVSGFSHTEAIGRTSVELGWISPKDRMRLMEELRLHGRVKETELTLLTKDKRQVCCIFNGELIRINNDQRLLSIAQDITNRKAVEEAVRQSEQTLRSLVNGHPESLFLMNTGGIVLVANEEVARRLDTTVPELIGSSIYESFPADVVEQRKNRINEAVLTGKAVQFEDVRLGRTIDNHIQPILDPQGKAVCLAYLGIDITDLRRAEQAQRRLATAIEQSAEAVLITDADGVIQYANPVTEQITGFARSEIIGNTPRIFKSGEHDRAFYEQLWNTIQAGNVWSGRMTNKKKDGTVYYEEATISPVRDTSGKIINFVSVKRDITEHLELSRQLVQAQKMEAVGTLAGGIAHDFNNVLQVVLGYSELVVADEDLPDRLRDDLGRVLLAGKNGADLVQRLLTFSRKTETKPLNLDLNQRIRQTQKFLERTIPKMIDIQAILADDLARIYADPTQVDQILMNLAVNARDAMPEGGRFVIETANVFLDEECDKALLGVKPGEYVLLSVSDTGHGMDKETLDHMFEPFYTTKEAGKGTGLGLAMVYGIVHQHGGYITCYSEPGEGTTFKMYFPATEMEIDQDVTKSGEMPALGTETILLVDDEEFVRDLGKRILERSGYTVLIAANGKEALDLYRREREKISLVILDLIMPEMGGRQCLEELLRIDPKARVLIASGFAANGLTREAFETGARGFVDKPYNMRGMLQSVRKVLDEV